MKKILVLTPRFPYPVIGGDRLRIYEICKELAKEYKLTLASLCETKEELECQVPEDEVFSEVHRVLLTKKKSYANCLFALPTSRPLQVAYYHSSSFGKLVKELARDHDMILSHLVRVAEYAKDLPIKKILEMTDAISMNYTRASETKNSAGFKGLVFKVEKNRLNRFEKNIAKDFDVNVLVSKYDKNFLFKPGSKEYDKTLVCSNGVDLSKFTYDFRPGSNEVVFIGNMFSAQNCDAAIWFAKEVLPLLRKHGDFKFKVIGRIKPDDMQRLKKYPGAIVTGAVEDVIEHARGAIAGICSVRLAAGVQNKILEYMALGLPTITTTIGLEGIEAQPNIEILIADNPQEYVNCILKLKGNYNFARSIAEHAHQYVLQHHSWSGRLKPVLDAVHSLI